MKKLLLSTVFAALAVGAFAQTDDVTAEPSWSPVGLNLVSPIGLPWGDSNITGLRLNLLYGHSLTVKGLDLGIVGVNRGNCHGLQLSGFNYTDGFFRGVQFNVLGSFVTKCNYGVQLSGLINWNLEDGAGVELGCFNFTGAYTGGMFGLMNWNTGLATGLDIGCVNVAAADNEGWSVGLSNYCKGNLSGCQAGVFNMVFGHSTGLQVGLFNASDHHTGVQIGLLNLNPNGALPIMPIVNINFN